MRVLITGAAVRVGRAIAIEFAGAGHRVIVHYRHSAEAARALLAELGGEAAGHLAVQADLDRRDQLEGLIPELVAAGHAPDCLINNAGTFPRTPLRSQSLDELAATFHTNCFAPFILMRDFANQVGRGAIVNLLDQRIASVNPDAGAYGIAKQALRDFTLAAALEWAPAIRVNAVAPGLALAPETMPPEVRARQVARVPMGRETEPAEIGRACRYLAEAETVTGQILYLDGGLHLTRLG